MATNTEELKLFKYDTEKDGKQTFNINKALNENWDKIDSFASSKGEADGIASLDSQGKVPETQLPHIASGLPIFCFNSGKIDENGNAALLSIENNILIQQAPCTCTTAEGKTYKIDEEVSLDISNLSDGEYNVFYDPGENQLLVFSNKIYIQKTQPEEWVGNDLWIDTSIKPYSCKRKTTLGIQVVQYILSSVLTIGVDIKLSNNRYNYSFETSQNTSHSLPLFTTVIQDHILEGNNTKGYALQGTYVYKESAPERYGYPEFYAKCIEEKNAGIETQTTLGETTITTYNNANGHIFYDIADKDIVDAYFASTGIAWFYGIDEENERVFLPRNNWFMQVTTDTSKVGQYIEAGLPNIEGKIGAIGVVGFVASGAFYDAGNGGSLSNSGEADKNAGFDASRFNKIYGKSDTVQPASVVNALYIVVGNNEQKSAITDVIEITTSENDTLPLFTGMYFDFSPNNPSWLKAGEQVNSGGIYTSCYNTLVNCLEGINPYNIKVVDVTNLEADIDYSEYWKVNQDEMWFKTPLSLSHKALTAGVKGNGNTIGLNNGSDDLFLINTNNNGGYGILQPRKNSGLIAGSANIGIVYTTSQTIGLNTIAEKTGIVVQESTAQLYFKVANAVQNLEIIDAGKILEALADKISRQDCATYVTETYNNELSWYRIWSPDHTGKRYYEEGGFVNTGTGKMNISFFFEFDSTPSIVGGIYSSSTNTSNFNSIAIADTNLSTTGFTIQRSGSTAKFWEVKGYLKD